ncbi:MAG: cyclic nucleotide-binding domain-containing protein [Telmatospirillum sp.]|nr:cyclic nucleotide-binding domain-containing protein [Telmatospirillum sp.]
MLGNWELLTDRLPLLGCLPAAERDQLLGNAVLQTVPPGTILFEQGTDPNFQHIIVAGRVHLFGRSADGREVVIQVVAAPDLLLPAAVLSASPYLTQARTLETTGILMIHAEAFRSAVFSQPALVREVIGSLSGQFRRMVRQIKNLKLRTSIERTGCYILSLSAQQQTPDRAVLPYGKNLIASELGITPESFSRALGSLQSHGISVQGDTIEIRDRRSLVAISAPDPLIDDWEEGSGSVGGVRTGIIDEKEKRS